jgi:transcriptional regulator with XRE-family HTH domain
LEQKKEENLVKKTCKELGITQKELAEKIGVSQQTITNWSRDFREGNLDNVTKMALESLLYKKQLENIKQNIENIN